MSLRLFTLEYADFDVYERGRKECVLDCEKCVCVRAFVVACVGKRERERVDDAFKELLHLLKIFTHVKQIPFSLSSPA